MTSVGAVLSQEGAVCLYEIVTPDKNLLQRNSSRALNPERGRRQEVLSAQAGRDHSRLAGEGMG